MIVTYASNVSRRCLSCLQFSSMSLLSRRCKYCCIAFVGLSMLRRARASCSIFSVMRRSIAACAFSASLLWWLSSCGHNGNFKRALTYAITMQLLQLLLPPHYANRDRLSIVSLGFRAPTYPALRDTFMQQTHHFWDHPVPFV
jgi:hypothetical protein